MNRLLAIFLALSLCPSECQAALRWAQSVHDLQAKTGQTEASFEYAFTNTGSRPVTIREIHTGCDCTTATLDRQTVPPNETGTLKVVFKFGDRVGDQRKIITVKTDDPDSPESLLSLHVVIPQMWNVSPRFLYWREGQSDASQTVTIRVGGEVPRKLIAAEVLEGAVKAELREDAPGQIYSLIVTPIDTTKPTKAMILIRAEDKTLPLVPIVYASVLSGSPPKIPATQQAK